MVDLDALEANIEAMADIARRHGRQLRPHVKAHKSTAIARRQKAAGAIGLCCATVREAEVMADAGLGGILLTTPVVVPAMIARLVAATEKVADFTTVVDSVASIDVLAERARVDKPIGVLIDIDVGQNRTGVTEPAEAVRLARRVVGLKTLRYRGVQAYYGHLQAVPTLAERRVRVVEQWARLAGFVDALKAAGLPPEIISGGGTGTHYFDVADGPFTEIQPGSYLFMDKQYNAVELAPEGSPFRVSLTVAAHVVSAGRPDRVIINAGTKAISTDAGPPFLAGAPSEGAVYQFMGDEHGAIMFTEGAQLPPLAALVHFGAPHCDPTVNLHDRFHVMRDGALIDIWPIEARGY